MEELFLIQAWVNNLMEIKKYKHFMPKVAQDGQSI